METTTVQSNEKLNNSLPSSDSHTVEKSFLQPFIHESIRDHNIKSMALKRLPLDLKFKNIKYNVNEYSITELKKGFISKSSKQVLRGVDGNFKAGELTAILGPSGAGKSSLLNILSGYSSQGMSGAILINGVERSLKNMDEFINVSRYIQQEENLRSFLTVKESMKIASNLKVGFNIPKEQKEKQIKEILSTLGLEKCYEELVLNLSGGECKRLAIALELFSNPSVLFLDEPTTGLDSSSCFYCISLLKKLSQEGRTVVCTIHQPSARLLEMFDKLYILADGLSVYNGPTSQLIPFLDKQNWICPPFHNPAEFLIEKVYEVQEDELRKLAESAKKFTENYNAMLKQTFISSINNDNSNGIENYLPNQHYKNDDEIISLKSKYISHFENSPPNFLQQTRLLLMRSLKITRRNNNLLRWRLFAHIITGMVFGCMYNGVGNNAEKVIANCIFFYGSLLFLLYTGQMAVTILFPLEMDILKREHFNKWYNLGPFILSMLSIEVPIQIICCCSFGIISYVLTGNILADFRVFVYFLFVISISLCGQAFGYLVGAIAPIKIAVFIGPLISVTLSMFGFCIRYIDTPYFFKWLFNLSYFRSAFHSIAYSSYGMNRKKLDCFSKNLKTCYFLRPIKVLKEMDATNINIWANFSYIIAVGLLFHFITVSIIWYKLNKR